MAFKSRLSILQFRRKSKMRYSAKKIQKTYRNYRVRTSYQQAKARKKHEKKRRMLELRMKNWDATTIQKCWRGRLGRKVAKLKRKKYVEKKKTNTRIGSFGLHSIVVGSYSYLLRESSSSAPSYSYLLQESGSSAPSYSYLLHRFHK